MSGVFGCLEVIDACLDREASTPSWIHTIYDLFERGMSLIGRLFVYCN